MENVSPEKLEKICHAILLASGARESEADIVTEELIETSLMGLDSHGILRLPQYVRQIAEGSIVPGSKQRIVKETTTTLLVDGENNFGMVTAEFMVSAVAAKTKAQHIACAASRHTHHIGRLGSWVQRLAEMGYFALATANASRQGHYVAPWGGTQGRLGTNPFAYACPSNGNPIVFDMSTSMIAEGSIRAAKQKGTPVPAHCILDPEGNPTTDPNDFYRDSWGAILPFGGEQGYKGYGLSLMVEILGATLAGTKLTPEGQSDEYINGFFIMAINPGAFGGLDNFRKNMDELSNYQRSSRPLEKGMPILLPGDREWNTRRQRIKEGIPVAQGTWDAICEAALSVGVEIAH